MICKTPNILTLVYILHLLSSVNSAPSDTSAMDWVTDDTNSRSFKYFKKTIDYAGAAGACKAEGAEIPVPYTVKENDFLRALIESGTHIWIDLNDHSTEGTFVTSYGKPASEMYVQWGTSEPLGARAEQCVVMSPSGTYHDIACTSKYNFVCMKNNSHTFYVGNNKIKMSFSFEFN